MKPLKTERNDFSITVEVLRDQWYTVTIGNHKERWGVSFDDASSPEEAIDYVFKNRRRPADVTPKSRSKRN